MAEIETENSGDAGQLFLELLNEHERSLRIYVLALIHDRGHAEDILQLARITMWKRFGDFEAGSNFEAWSRKIALNQILNHRRSAKRKPLHLVDPEFVESIAQEIDRQSDHLALRSEALRKCIKQLPETHRTTILLRYHDDCDISKIAELTSRTETAVYRLLSRIRAALNECITDQIRNAS